MGFERKDELNNQFMAITISNMTGIDSDKLLEYFTKYGVNGFFDNLDEMDFSGDERQKLNEFKKML